MPNITQTAGIAEHLERGPKRLQLCIITVQNRMTVAAQRLKGGVRSHKMFEFPSAGPDLIPERGDRLSRLPTHAESEPQYEELV